MLTPFGLYNPKNLCYCNVVIQLLFSIPEFQFIVIKMEDYYNSDNQSKDKDKPSIFNPLLGLKGLFIALFYKKKINVSFFAYKYFSNSYKKMQDSHEFFCKLFQDMDVYRKQSSDTNDFIDQLFYFQTQISFLDKHMPIEKSLFLSLPPSINIENDTIDIGEMDYSGQKANAYTKVLSYPKYSMFHIMRYSQNQSTNFSYSIDKTPITLKTTISLKNKEYILKAVIDHVGPNPQLGHYTIHLRYRNDWYLINDTSVNMIKNPNSFITNNKQCYIVVYEEKTNIKEEIYNSINDFYSKTDENLNWMTNELNMWMKFINDNNLYTETEKING